MRLQLESATETLDLNSVAERGWGVQAIKGVTGMGLPPVNVQWDAGAGDGAIYRGRRVATRDIDIPLYFAGRTRTELQELLGQFSRVVSGPCTLRATEPDGTSWTLQVARTGGGGYVYGQDTIGETELRLVVTLTAGDPFWRSSQTVTQLIGGPREGLLPDLSQLKVTSGAAVGDVTLVNPGDVAAFPVWEVRGPGYDLVAQSSTGESFLWGGTLGVGETLTIDTETGRAYDGTGANRYADFDAAPRLWTVPPGTTIASIQIQGADQDTQVKVSFRPRRWMVV